VTRALVLAALLASCEKPDHVTGTITMTGEPAFAPDRCEGGTRYGATADTHMFRVGPDTLGLLIVKPGAQAQLIYTPPRRGAEDMALDPWSHCKRFDATDSHVRFDCTVPDGTERHLAGELDFSCEP
jgi:hypothetical protein